MWLRFCGQVLRLDRTLCPEGTIGLSLGFQPQGHAHPRRALKGRQDFLFDCLFGDPHSLRERFCRPFRAGRLFDRYLGLKPQAQSCSPFGTKRL
jgi:hypothetical protein